MKGTNTKGSAIMMKRWLRSAVTDIKHAREQLRPDVEHEQDRQDPAGRLGGQVRDEEELRAARIDLVAADVRELVPCSAAYFTMPGQMSIFRSLRSM